jgi:ATP-dependent protease ClpP protease subunit
MSRQALRVDMWQQCTEPRVAQRPPCVPDAPIVSEKRIDADLSQLHIGHEVGLIDKLMQYTRSPFAGHYIRNEKDTKDIIRQIPLPLWVVPMCAPFNKPYTDDFLAGVAVALDHIRSSSVVEFENEAPGVPAQHMILVPISSPGGDISLLKMILTYLETIRADVVPCTDGSKRRHVKIVTYGFGTVASCAFVLYQGGDMCMASDNAEFMCHEPSYSFATDGCFRQNAERADHSAHELMEIKTMIYTSAERHIYERCCRHDGANETNETLLEWRARWFDEHTADGSIVAFAKNVREYKLSAPPAYQIDALDVFDYLVKLVAINVTDQVITAEWMLKLGLCEEAGVDVRMADVETISLTYLPGFKDRMRI